MLIWFETCESFEGGLGHATLTLYTFYERTNELTGNENRA